MKATKQLSSCVGLACLLGCAPVTHPTARVPVQPNLQLADDSRRGEPEAHRRIVPLPDDLLLGTSSREERDAVMESLVYWIATFHSREYFIGSYEAVNQPGSEGRIRYYDPSPQLMHALVNLGPRMKPLSTSDRYGTRIIIGHITVSSNKANIDVTVSSSPSMEGMHFNYLLWFKDGRWQSTHGDDVKDFWVD
jgi:hypothetical protein